MSDIIKKIWDTDFRRLAQIKIKFSSKTRIYGSAQPPAKKTAGQIEKETSQIHRAIIDCGSGLLT
jgi:hypothetical protein